jgi:hypothetical protein
MSADLEGAMLGGAKLDGVAVHDKAADIPVDPASNRGGFQESQPPSVVHEGSAF